MVARLGLRQRQGWMEVWGPPVWRQHVPIMEEVVAISVWKMQQLVSFHISMFHPSLILTTQVPVVQWIVNKNLFAWPCMNRKDFYFFYHSILNCTIYSMTQINFWVIRTMYCAKYFWRQQIRHAGFLFSWYDSNCPINMSSWLKYGAFVIMLDIFCSFSTILHFILYFLQVRFA
jgi:hypothetical protein